MRDDASFEALVEHLTQLAMMKKYGQLNDSLPGSTGFSASGGLPRKRSRADSDDDVDDEYDDDEDAHQFWRRNGTMFAGLAALGGGGLLGYYMLNEDTQRQLGDSLRSVLGIPAPASERASPARTLALTAFGASGALAGVVAGRAKYRNVLNIDQAMQQNFTVPGTNTLDAVATALYDISRAVESQPPPPQQSSKPWERTWSQAQETAFGTTHIDVATLYPALHNLQTIVDRLRHTSPRQQPAGPADTWASVGQPLQTFITALRSDQATPAHTLIGSDVNITLGTVDSTPAGLTVSNAQTFSIQDIVADPKAFIAKVDQTLQSVANSQPVAAEIRRLLAGVANVSNGPPAQQLDDVIRQAATINVHTVDQNDWRNPVSATYSAVSGVQDYCQKFEEYVRHQTVVGGKANQPSHYQSKVDLLAVPAAMTHLSSAAQDVLRSVANVQTTSTRIPAQAAPTFRNPEVVFSEFMSRLRGVERVAEAREALVRMLESYQNELSQLAKPVGPQQLRSAEFIQKRVAANMLENIIGTIDAYLTAVHNAASFMVTGNTRHTYALPSNLQSGSDVTLKSVSPIARMAQQATAVFNAVSSLPSALAAVVREGKPYNVHYPIGPHLPHVLARRAAVMTGARTGVAGAATSTALAAIANYLMGRPEYEPVTYRRDTDANAR